MTVRSDLLVEVSGTTVGSTWYSDWIDSADVHRVTCDFMIDGSGSFVVQGSIAGATPATSEQRPSVGQIVNLSSRFFRVGFDSSSSSTNFRVSVRRREDD